ncbi:integral membrane protein [Amycolatopsis keratiniphila]|uniref:Integral membrane protein n=1 Tax=Amycolatopsis keratiniphila TaxID=129921 RepID=R4SJB8_9PSEU|nr:integral membrane protein [Amycolatopsis keratiniphila]AGM03719.1 integral membrane protein [Amycolatopsis keratiniphila]
MTETGGPSGPEGTETPKPQADQPAQPQADSPTPPRGEAAQQWQSPSGATPPPPLPSYQPPPQQQYPNWKVGLGRPGVIPLRPLNLTDILDGAVTTMRRYWRMVFGSAAVVAVLSAGLSLIGLLLIDTSGDLERLRDLGPAATDQELLDAMLGGLGGTLLAALVSTVVTLLGTTLLTGFLTILMGKAALGKPVDFKETLKEAASRLLPLLGLTLLYALATMVAFLFCVLPAVVPFTFWALASPALLLERGTVRESLRRSVKLVSGMFWRVFGILLLTVVISGFLKGIIETPFSFSAFLGIFGNIDEVYIPSTGDLVLQSVGTMIAETIVGPFTALVTVILYIDQRMRREGMDIELARAAGIQAPPPPQAW